MLNWLPRSVDPRRSLAARIAWVFGLLSILISILAGIFITGVSNSIIEREIGSLFADRAQHITDAIDIRIKSLIDKMLLVGSGFNEVRENKSALASEQFLAETKNSVVGAAWVGIVTPNGVVLADDGGGLKGTDISELDWFKKKSLGVSVNGAVLFPELQKIGGAEFQNKKLSYLTVVTPAGGPNELITMYAVVCFSMGWVENIELQSVKSLADSRPIDVFLLARDGTLITPLKDGAIPEETDLTDYLSISTKIVAGGNNLGTFTTDNYLVGYARSQGSADFEGTGWTVVVRESKATAYLPAYSTAFAISVAGLALGLCLTAVAAFGTKYILGGLAKIAASAEALRTGASHQFLPTKGRDEVAVISHSLAILYNDQQRLNEQLHDLNQNLDQKILERTREVQRLSEETKIAAITRERLRMSRDLHDTLAHSMIAMLTQIRLMQKLQKRKPEMIADELALAEAAALEGLDHARQAVAELRYFAVRDDGLGQALVKLVKSLKERMEVDVTLNVDDLTSEFVGPKAETTYRIVEEALRNVEKHSQATEVRVEIALDRTDRTNQVLKAVITDNGKGFDSSSSYSGHYGLVGMKEQAELQSGKINVASIINKGTIIDFEVIL